ncbi:HipA domain-containing protein [Yeosuana marina]|uniref:type II toxin-antitoxin system HipA family toxin n=1 Tax=Yeosuana marina TaxID=1565536 RepID=UPI0030C82D8A
MATGKLDIFVYAHWKGMEAPQLVGILSALAAKGRKAFSFEYDKDWITSKQQMLLDPDLQFFTGPQYPNNKENFGVFLDSMPDTWGRTLMKRREAQYAKEQGERARTLYEIDYLLGVYDESRMGALRFKTDRNGPFLDNNNQTPTPPWSSIRELQDAASNFENEDGTDEVKKWLAVLMAPGSSLGGARPKANILDGNKDLWIAKFPSKNDTIDKAAWEYLAYLLAIKAGIHMAPSKIEKITGRFNTFFTKRFDREDGERIHFASAMTMTGNNEDTIRDTPASYLELAEFVQNHGAMVNDNLEQLWRRIIFNIAISNTDDHLRNHGFILTSQGWILSPAYDLNPSIDKGGLALNIDMDNNALDYDLAMSVGAYFRLDDSQMEQIKNEVLTVVGQWQSLADSIGISKKEQNMMSKAFHV